MTKTWTRVSAALALLAFVAVGFVLATDGSVAVLAGAGAVFLVAGVAAEVLSRRRLHAAAGLDHLGFLEADEVLREARGGPIPQDPAARAETIRVVQARRQVRARATRFEVPLLLVAAVVGVALVVLGEGWALVLPAGALGRFIGMRFERHADEHRLVQLRGTVGA